MSKNKTIFYSISASLMLLIAVGLFYFSSLSDKFRSVEFGIVELSPAGLDGGYAMPASGASAPTSLHEQCSSDGTQVTLSWSASQPLSLNGSGENQASIWDFLGFSEAYALGGGGSSESTPPPSPPPLHTPPHTVVYGLVVGDIVNEYGLTSTSYNVSITPDTKYDWLVRACDEDGVCSQWQSGSFECDGPPTLELTADEYEVQYGEGTNLNWTTKNADSCSVSGGWSGSRSSANGTWLHEPTGPLTKQTTYIMQCTGPTGSTLPSSATIGVKHGEGADIEACKGVVRKGESFCLNWDTGTSDPQYCVLQAGKNVLQGPLSSTKGTTNTSIVGETTFTLNCEEGGNTSDITVKVLPEFQET